MKKDDRPFDNWDEVKRYLESLDDLQEKIAYVEEALWENTLRPQVRQEPIPSMVFGLIVRQAPW